MGVMQSSEPSFAELLIDSWILSDASEVFHLYYAIGPYFVRG